MKKVKYIASILFIMVIQILIGDMYVWNIDSFETEYISTSMYLPAGVSQNTMISDIEECAKKYNVLVFAVSRNMESLYSETVSVYCMDGAEEILSEKSSISQGNYRSIFLGDVAVKMESLEHIPDVNKMDTYYFIGSMEQARKFKSELIDIYSGNMPKEGYVYFHAVRTIACGWGVGIGFFLLLTLFETVLLKKEIVVRFIYGQSLAHMILKQIAADWIFYIGSFVAGNAILKKVFAVSVDYCMAFSILCITIFCIFNSLLYLRLFFIDYKSSLSRGKGNQRVLKISYMYKIITVVIVVCVMSVCIEMIVSGVQYQHQKPFFAKHNRWEYVSISSGDGDIDTTNQLMLSFLKEKSDGGEAFLNIYLDDGMFSQKPCLLFNQGAKDYLTENIKDIQEYCLEDKIYFIVPESNHETYTSDLAFMAEMYIGENIDYEVITYHSKVSLIGIVNKGNMESKLFDMPLIILNMRNDTDYYNPIYIAQACMFDMDVREWETYISDNHIYENTTFTTNVYDNYIYSLKNYQRLLILGSVIFIILVLMEFIIIKTILQYECMVNAMELTIKTVLGYSITEKYRKMFLSTLVSLAISSLISVAIMSLFGTTASLYIILGCLLLAGMEVAVMVHYIGIIEKANIQKVLKGCMI
ncbi:MAG: hypothetical protein K2M46_07285 [Lachnospiraceae bacterium]|nr:hypothetical protein [Lachnospiraceae bacterium]